MQKENKNVANPPQHQSFTIPVTQEDYQKYQETLTMNKDSQQKQFQQYQFLMQKRQLEKQIRDLDIKIDNITIELENAQKIAQKNAKKIKEDLEKKYKVPKNYKFCQLQLEQSGQPVLTGVYFPQK
jgi:hypothetical protein